MKFLKHMLAVYESGVVDNQQSGSSRTPGNEYTTFVRIDPTMLFIIFFIIFALLITTIVLICALAKKTKELRYYRNQTEYNIKTQNNYPQYYNGQQNQPLYPNNQYDQTQFQNEQYNHFQNPNRPFGGSN